MKNIYLYLAATPRKVSSCSSVNVGLSQAAAKWLIMLCICIPLPSQYCTEENYDVINPIQMAAYANTFSNLILTAVPLFFVN